MDCNKWFRSSKQFQLGCVSTSLGIRIRRTNGGIIGKSNQASFGQCVVTIKTSTGSVPVSSSTRAVNVLAVAGGGAGGRGAPAGGGGGAGGIVQGCIQVCSSVAVVIGAGGTGGASQFPSSPLSYAPGCITTATGINSTQIVQSCGGGGGGARGPVVVIQVQEHLIQDSIQLQLVVE